MTSLRIFKAGFSVMGIIILSLCLGLTVLSVNAYAERSTPVTVVNPSTDPVPVVNTFPREPVVFKTGFTGGGGDLFTVPDDRWLVIETVSARLLSRTPLEEIKIAMIVDGGYGKKNMRYFIPISSDLSSGGSANTGYVGTQSFRVYAEPGTELGWELSIMPSDAGILCEISFSGYLLPLDSPTLSP